MRYEIKNFIGNNSLHLLWNGYWTITGWVNFLPKERVIFAKKPPIQIEPNKLHLFALNGSYVWHYDGINKTLNTSKWLGIYRDIVRKIKKEYKVHFIMKYDGAHILNCTKL